MHDYEQNLILDCIRTYMIYDMCLLGFDLNIHRVLHVLSVCYKILYFCVFFF